MIYGISKATWRVLGTLVWHLEVRGGANVPPSGGVILAVNHQSFLDVVLLASFTKRPVRYMARSTLWDSRILGWIISDLRAIPFNRERPGKAELRGLLDIVRGGELLALFPEGTRTRDGSIGEFRGGIGFLARKAGVPVVPVLLQGSFEAWPRGRTLPRRGSIRIACGRPVLYAESWEDREVAADIRRRLLVLRDDPGVPRPVPEQGRAACAPLGGEGAA